MRTVFRIVFLFFLTVLASCHSPQREVRQMAQRAERLFDTMPDSTFKLIDSILRMPVYFNEKHRMDMALLQGEALFGDRGQEIPPLMDDEFFDDKPFLSTSPELERAADYYARKKQYAKAAWCARSATAWKALIWKACPLALTPCASPWKTAKCFRTRW